MPEDCAALVYDRLLGDVVEFARVGSGIKLRRYQEEVARAIVRSVSQRLGHTLVVVFPRQSGKNELQAQVEAFLLAVFSIADVEIVKASPTWKPQGLNAMRRLERVLDRNLVTRGLWRKESGYLYCLGRARIAFLAGTPHAHVVGATANLLLECDEAQDVLPAKWDKDFAPMAASTDATRLFWGTMWTSRTLLARELRLARQAEAADGIGRAWVLTAAEVAAEAPEYGRFVAGQAARLGRQHPLVRSQYFSEEIDADAGMFPERRLVLMRGTHSRQRTATGGRLYAMLIDVAGEDEQGRGRWNDSGEGELGRDELANPGRDSTALTVVEVDLSDLEARQAPVYRVVDRRTWTGVRHAQLYGQILALAEAWRALYLVIDATGVGAGLASFLDRALPGKVISFVFNQATKSKLGWGFLGVIETGRYQEWQTANDRWQDDEQDLFWRQCLACQMEVLDGPERRMRGGAPDGARDPETGEVMHDDLVVSAALCAVLDEQGWAVGGEPLVVRGRDPLEEIDREGF